MSLFAFPNQALKQDDHRNRGNREPQTIEVHIREHDQIHKDQKIRDREAGKAEPAPQEKLLLYPDRTRTLERRGGRWPITFYSRSFLSWKDRANFRTAADGLEWISLDIRSTLPGKSIPRRQRVDLDPAVARSGKSCMLREP